MVNRIIFPSILQIGYVEVRISRSISESPLKFEITRVDCISWNSGWKYFIFALMLDTGLKFYAVTSQPTRVTLKSKSQTKKQIMLKFFIKVWEAKHNSASHADYCWLCLSVCLLVFLSVCLSSCLYVRLSVYLRKMDTLSGHKTLSKLFCLPSTKGFTGKGKNFLLNLFWKGTALKGKNLLPGSFYLE